MRGKSTTLSRRAPIYYVDLTLRGDATLAQAVAAARTEWEARKAAGMDQAALEDAARSGLALGEFEESEEDGVAVVEEFYPMEVDGLDDGSAGTGSGIRPELVDKLRQRARRNPLLGAGNEA